MVAVRRTTKLFGGVAAVLMIAVAPATAAEVVGSDLVAAPAFSAFGAPSTQTTVVQAAGVTLPLTASKAGVIVEVKIRHTSPPVNSMGGFSILSGISPDFTARTSSLLPDFAWQNGQDGGVRTFKPSPDAGGAARGVPIAAGERLAYRHVSGGTSPLLFANGGTYRATGSNHVSGPVSYPITGPAQALLQMRIEPDVDGDGYGDETQDPCPILAGLTCAPPCQNATKVGTSGNDVIFGTAGNDVIATNGGDDIVRGLGGDDVICGGDGNDKLKGGAGKDRLYGEAGRDKLRGGGGKDSCFGGADKDAIGCEKAKQN